LSTIEKGYEKRGVSKDEAERRAWATVKKSNGGEKKRKRTGQKVEQPAKKDGRKGGTAERKVLRPSQ
jgi:hypothetical protein